ncbi:MAG TPA: hypothetical protein ENN44_02245 [Methanoculleus sp.]|nr:hypothetical protein [Methanoculleus sp.]
MRRIYHRFPRRCDLVFDINVPFSDAAGTIVRLNGTHEAARLGDEMVRIDFQVQVADQKISFLPVDEVAGLLYNLTEAVDFQIELKETLLSSERRIPRSRNVFLVRLEEVGMATECTITKTSSMTGLDALDLKRLILGAVR